MNLTGRVIASNGSGRHLKTPRGDNVAISIFEISSENLQHNLFSNEIIKYQHPSLMQKEAIIYFKNGNKLELDQPLASKILINEIKISNLLGVLTLRNGDITSGGITIDEDVISITKVNYAEGTYTFKNPMLNLIELKGTINLHKNGTLECEGTCTFNNGDTLKGTLIKINDEKIVSDENAIYTWAPDDKNIKEYNLCRGRISISDKKINFIIGAYFFKDHSKFEFNTINIIGPDLISGSGKRIYANGTIYIGEIVENKKHGIGKFIRNIDKFVINENQTDNIYKEGNLQNLSLDIRKVKESDDKFLSKEEVEANQLGEIALRTHGNSYEYEGEWKNDKKDGYGIYVELGGNTYIGHFSADQQNGEGELIDKNNVTLYKGNWAEGQFHGEGTFYFEDDSRYVGNFQNGRRDGIGTIYGFDNNKEEIILYAGEWKEDKKHGQGELTNKDGSKYNGILENDKIAGFGKLTYPNNDRYEGHFINDKKHGYGVFYYANHDRYVGDFVEDKKHGNGTLHFSNGDYIQCQWNQDIMCHDGDVIHSYRNNIYNGEWKNNKPHGQGEYHYKNGYKYTGDWQEGKFYGKGYYQTNEFTKLGEFNNGNLSHGVMYDKLTKCKYEGHFVDNKKHGYGTFYDFSDKSTYIGDWEDDERHGNGECKYNDGSKYVGDWNKGKKQGFGKFYDKNNFIKYDGKWQNNSGINGKYFDRNIGHVYEGRVSETGEIADGALRIYCIPRNTPEREDGLFQEYHNLLVKNSDNSDLLVYNESIGGFLVYDGEYLNRLKNGIGKSWNPNGNFYDGNWENNLQHGLGTLINIYGQKYEAEWENGKIIEIDKIIMKDHNSGEIKITGKTVKGEIIEGKIEFTMGIYTGGIQANSMHGKGMFNYIGGICYEGHWNKDVKEGFGKLIYPGGNIYEGYFLNDQLHGHAKEFLNDRLLYDGEWIDGSKQGYGISYYYLDTNEGTENVENYKGDFEDDRKHGKGKYTYTNGDTFEGEWKDDIPTNGKLTLKNGTVFIGIITINADKRIFTGVDNISPVCTLINGDSIKARRSLEYNIRDGNITCDFGVYTWPQDISETSNVNLKENITNISENSEKNYFEGCFVINLEGELKGIGKYINRIETYRNNHYETSEKNFLYINNRKITGRAFHFSTQNDRHYDGIWENSKRIGQGQLKLKSKFTIEGIFDEDDLGMIYCSGSIKTTDGSRIDSKKIMLFPDGKITCHEAVYAISEKMPLFTGYLEFNYTEKNFSYTCMGRYTDKNHNIFEGREFSLLIGNDLITGKNIKVEYVNGDVYEGALTNNLKDGYGEIIFSNGSMYKGNWKDNKPHGKGMSANYTTKQVDGNQFEILIVDSNENIHDFQRTKYEGDWISDNKNGVGTEYYLHYGSNYNGEFKDGFPKGHGKFTSSTRYNIDGLVVKYLPDKKTLIFSDAIICKIDDQEEKLSLPYVTIDIKNNSLEFILNKSNFNVKAFIDDKSLYFEGTCLLSNQHKITSLQINFNSGSVYFEKAIYTLPEPNNVQKKMLKNLWPTELIGMFRIDSEGAIKYMGADELLFSDNSKLSIINNLSISDYLIKAEGMYAFKFPYLNKIYNISCEGEIIDNKFNASEVSVLIESDIIEKASLTFKDGKLISGIFYYNNGCTHYYNVSNTFLNKNSKKNSIDIKLDKETIMIIPIDKYKNISLREITIKGKTDIEKIYILKMHKNTTDIQIMDTKNQKGFTQSFSSYDNPRDIDANVEEFLTKVDQLKQLGLFPDNALNDAIEHLKKLNNQI